MFKFLITVLYNSLTAIEIRHSLWRRREKQSSKRPPQPLITGSPRLPTGLLVMTVILVFSHASYSAQKPRLIFSITPIASLAAMVTKERAEIKVIASGQGCPHHYSARPSDLISLEKADLLVFIDEGFDSYAFKLAAGKDNKIIRIGDLKRLHILSHRGHKNLHLWLDLDNAEIILEELAEIFTTTFPEIGEELKYNLKEAKAKIANLRTLRRNNLKNLSDAILISDSAEYFFAGTNVKRVFAPHHITLKYVTHLQEVIAGGKKRIFISPDQNVGFLEGLPVERVIIESENWALSTEAPLSELYVKKYQEIIATTISPSL